MNFIKGPSFDTLRALETVPNMYLVLSSDLYILTASDLYLEAVSAKRSDIVGKHIFEAFPANPELPEADGVQNINASLQEVLRTKKQHFMSVQRYDVPDINNPGKFIQRYWDPSHKPILDSQGNIEYIIQLATNVSDKILTERALVKSQQEQSASMEQLKALNNELLATNIEFKETQQDLSLLNAELEERVARRTLALAASEQKFRSLIENNPIAMQVYRGEEMRFEINNEAMLQFLGKTADINGKTLFEAVPEIIGQPIVEKLYHVFRTGEPLELKAEQVSLQRNGKNVTGYYDVTYRALYEDDQITGILGIAIDVTTQIVALQELEASDEKLKIAIETGKMGTWSIDLDSLTIETSDFVKKLLGLQPQKTYVIADFLSLINPSFQQPVTHALGNALRDHKTIDISYPVQNLLTGEEKWVRVTGKALLGGNEKAAQFTGMLIDITQQKADEQRKNDFIGMVSHELKTPITSLNAYLQMLQTRARKEDDTFTQGALDQSVKQVKRMTTMINGFLNVSRLESGKIAIDKQKFDMAELVRESEIETLPMYTSHQIMYAPVEETFVNGDREKIGQVINNLINNAVKYSKPGSTVNVACVTIDDRAVVSIKDEGIGIAKEEINKLFQRYYRVEGSNHIAGFGIGLYLSAEIIERHQGEIWAESEPGQGSTFYFSLPVLN